MILRDRKMQSWMWKSSFIAVVACFETSSSRRDLLPTLQHGSAESVGLLSLPLQDMVANLTAYTRAANYGAPSHNETHPIEPGSVTLVAHKGVIVSYVSVGKRNLYKDSKGTFLPSGEQEDATTDTVYDIASLTKLFTTVAALRELDKDTLSLNRSVASYVPEFAANGKENVTVQMLLTHTSGLDGDPSPSLCSAKYNSSEERKHAIFAQELRNRPGSTFLYSDLNFMSLAIMLERITSLPLDELIYSYTAQLELNNTFFNRGNLEGTSNPHYKSTAAQEFQIELFGVGEPQRPQPVRGSVHDENAYCLGGVAGHAGLFSTVIDTAIFCQMILNNGTYNGHRILSPDVVDLIFTNFNSNFPGNEHGLGFELNQFYTAGPMASLQTASHTGFTGTSVVIARSSNTLFVHFSNRVHPDRSWGNNNIVRKAIGYWVARSLGRNVTFPA